MNQDTTARRRPSAARSTAGDTDADQDSIALQTSIGFASSTRSRNQKKEIGLSRWKICTSPLLATLLAIFLTTSILISRTSEFKWKTLGGGGLGDASGLDRIGRPSHIGVDLHPEEYVYRLPRTISYEWEISSDFRFPDGVRKRLYLINDQFPGPTIEARSGDTLKILVKNGLSGEGLSLHWHGLHMKGFNHMDGAVGFTQSPIPAGDNFTYEFRIDEHQYGTFWYHAHSQSQRGDGLFGGLVVHQPAESSMDSNSLDDDFKRYGYEREILLMIGDWYHRSADEVLGWFTSTRGFGNEPVPDSLLINGIGKFNCSNAVPARPVECVTVDSRTFPGILSQETSSLRMRVVNVGSLAGFSFRIDDAKMTAIEIDGGSRIKQQSADSIGILYPGERVDVLVKWATTFKPQDPLFEITLDSENFKYPNPALTPKQSLPMFSSNFLTETIEVTSNTKPESQSHFSLQAASSSDAANPSLPRTANKTIILYTKTLKLAKHGNHPKGFINQTSWSPQNPPLLSTPHELWDKNQFVVPIRPLKSLEENKSESVDSNDQLWVDIIINNLDDGGHPFHLHGHSFYVLETYRSERGWGSYKYHGKEFEFDVGEGIGAPVLKDTVLVPRRGYAILRFLANNKGIWMLHCHMLVHLGSGMAMGFEID